MKSPNPIAVRIAAAIGVTVVLLSGGGAPTARASGVGPNIALGTVSGTTVPVYATNATDPYKGFNIHIHAELGAGVTLSGIVPSSAFTVVPTTRSGSPICAAGIPPGLPTDKVYACTALSDPTTPGADGTTASGELASFTINATGNGCVTVSLVTSAAIVPDTFTINEADSTRQSNRVDTSTVAQIAVGNGSPQDCPPAPPAPPPVIYSVSPVVNQGNPAIVIQGFWFGGDFPAADISTPATTPYLQLSGPSECLPILGCSGQWSAGHTSSSTTDPCKVTVSQWRDDTIVLTADGVGTGGLLPRCPLFTGHSLTLTVWSTTDPTKSASMTVPVVAQSTVSVSSVSPVDGPRGGGTFVSLASGAVTIRGSGLSGVQAVLFGPFAAHGFAVLDDSTIVVQPPPATANEGVSVRVITGGGSSAACGDIHLGCDDAYFYMDHVLGAPWTTPVSLPGAGAPFSQSVGGVTVKVSASGSLTPDVDLEASFNDGVPSAFIMEGTLGVDATIQATLGANLSLGQPVDVPIPVGLPEFARLNVRLDSAALSAAVTAGATVQGQLSFDASWIPDGKGGVGLPVSQQVIPGVGFPFVQQQATLTCAGTVVSSLSGFSNCLSNPQWPTSSIDGSVVVSPIWLEVGPQLGVLQVDAGIGPTFGLAGGVTSAGTAYTEVCGDISGQVEAKLPALNIGYSTPPNQPLPGLGPYHIAGSSPTHCPLGATATSTSPTGTASVVTTNPGGRTVSGSAVGSGTLTMAQYLANPVGPATFPALGTYFDSLVSSGSSFASLTLTDCALNGGDGLTWWTGAAWAPVQPAGTVDHTTGCLTTTLDGTSSPSLTQLTGTVFGVSECPIQRADVDGDGQVSILDLAAVAGDFLETVPPAPARYDQDGDGVISILDLATMASYFLQPVTACP